MTTWYSNPGARHWVSEMPAPQVGAFHQTLPGYAPTPIVDLPSLAAELGVGRVLVKDESARLEKAVDTVLADGYRTGDIMQPGMTKVGTTAMTDAILKALDKSA